MTLELKALKIHEDMSEETLCFSASIYWKRKRIAIVKNEGRGGCNHYTTINGRNLEWIDFKEWVDGLELYYEDNGEPVTFEKMDHVVDIEISRIHMDREFKKLTKDLILFRLKKDPESGAPPEDGWRTVEHKGMVGPCVTWLRGKYGSEISEMVYKIDGKLWKEPLEAEIVE
jgi:hypothetical protein